MTIFNGKKYLKIIFIPLICKLGNLNYHTVIKCRSSSCRGFVKTGVFAPANILQVTGAMHPSSEGTLALRVNSRKSIKFHSHLQQVNFSEKGTKMTSQLHISKLEILSFFDKIHKNNISHSFFSFKKCVTSHQSKKKITVFMDFIGDTKDFKF